MSDRNHYVNPFPASLDDKYKEALDCLEKVMFEGGRDGQCLNCKFNEFCSGAFQHILIGSGDKN